MEDRRCRKAMAVVLVTVIIMILSVQNVSAAPKSWQGEGSLDNLLGRFTKTVFTAVYQEEGSLNNLFDSFKKTVLTNVENVQEKQYFKVLKDKVIGEKENTIIFVIEQLPRITTPNHDSKKVAKTVNNTVSKNVNHAISVSRGGETDILKEDIELLARIIHAEARGESIEGQIAVGAVVLNRVQHPDYPKSIKEVVYQPGQFSAVTDKQIELTPDENAYKAAQAALEGQDPSNGAIFYYNPKIATDPWIKTRSIIRSIGNHKFCV